MLFYNRIKLLLAGGLVVMTVVCSLTQGAGAVPIRVSQESSAGAGDFDANVLGFIDPFSTGLTIVDFYSYGNPNFASYNGDQGNGGPVPVSSLSQMFLVDASDGLSLVMFHDKPNDSIGGTTSTQFDLLGGDTASIVVKDDSGETYTDTGTLFTALHSWAPANTDGYAIGSLDGNWTMLGQFVTGPNGISAWSAVSSVADGGDPTGFTTISLSLTAGQRVRLDVQTPVPEPATIALLGIGLAGMAIYGVRRRRQCG